MREKAQKNYLWKANSKWLIFFQDILAELKIE